jgi:MGT family glycosyltransferase
VARFLIGAWPYAGHLHPSVFLGRVLRDRGHEVAFYTGATDEDPVAQEGFVRFGFDGLAEALSAATGLGRGADEPGLYAALTRRYSTFDRPSPLDRLRRTRALYGEMVIGTLGAQVEDLVRVRRTFAPDVIVADPFLWAPFVVLHETQDAPVAVFSFYAGCLVPGKDAPPPGLGLPSRRGRPRWRGAAARLAARAFAAVVERRVDAVRRRYRLRPLGMSVGAWLGRMPLHLVCSSPEFDYERQDLPASVHYVGPCGWEGRAGGAPAGWAAGRESGRPLVYVSEGTAQVRSPLLLRAAIEAFRELAADVVVTTGRHRDPERIGLDRVPPNVRVERFVPQSLLMPWARVVVTNGGSNTVRGALQGGVPLVVVPMEWDQLDNAQRVAEAGAGLRLPIGRCTPRALRAAVERVLAGASFREGALRIAESFARYGHGRRAAELLEALAARRLPQGNA